MFTLQRNTTEGATWNQQILRYSILSVFLFLLMWEWVRPLSVVFSQQYLYIWQPFLVVIAGFLFLELLPMKSWGKWMLKGLLCIAVVETMYFPASYVSIDGWMKLFQLLWQDIHVIFQGNVAQMSLQMRGLLFFFGWGLLSNVFQSLLIYRQHGMWLVTATVMYLIIMQLWFGVDSSFAFIRTIGVGFSLLTFMQLPRIERSFLLPLSKRGWPFSWVMASTFIVGGLIAVSLTASSSQPKQVKPVDMSAYTAWLHPNAYMQSFSWSSLTGGALALSGYESNDEQLGGALKPDTSIAFTAITPQLTYWRGESKNYYTGKGWRQPTMHWIHNSTSASLADTGAAKSNEIIQEVTVRDTNIQHHLVYGGEQISQMQAMFSAQGKWMQDSVDEDTISGKYNVEGNQQLTYYKIKVLLPAYSAAKLQLDQSATSPSIKETYLQLPSDLPQRVKDLTETIIAGADNNYDRAVHIQRYLQDNYTYSLSKATLPPTNADFADYFLFDSKVGYCDYFSTAMVVMLRSVGIPARWVKGYAPGSVSETNGNSYTVVVRNSDAHSWVEAYFPQLGWVPFDPTPGFNANAGENKPVSLQLAGNNMTQSTGNSTTIIPSQKKQAGLWINLRKLFSGRFFSTIHTNIWMFIFTIFSLIGLLLIAISLKSIFFLPLELRKFEKKRDGNWPQLFLERVWLKIFKQFGNKQDSQTMREYVESLPKLNDIQKSALMELVEVYEKARYDVFTPVRLSKRKLVTIWKQIHAGS